MQEEYVRVLVLRSEEVLEESEEEEEMSVEVTPVVPSPLARIQAADVVLVMSQTGCSRDEAINMLIKHDNDLVYAIMDMTSGVDIPSWNAVK